MTKVPSSKVEHETPSQTAGPYVHIGMAPRAAGFEMYPADLGARIASDTVSGQKIRIEGCIFDGDGLPVTDALIEAWQADSFGRYAERGKTEPGFSGWGRAASDFQTGLWRFDTIHPGAVGGQAPYVSLWIVARGINTGLHTRLYFTDAPELASDPLLASLDAEHRATLLAHPMSSDGPLAFRFDIRLQGEGETVFFDV